MRLGDHNQSVMESSQRVIRASHIIIHSLYSSVSLDYDVSLIRLAEEVSYSQGVSPVCMPGTSDTASDADTQCVGTGWQAALGKYFYFII